MTPMHAPSLFLIFFLSSYFKHWKAFSTLDTALEGESAHGLRCFSLFICETHLFPNLCGGFCYVCLFLAMALERFRNMSWFDTLIVIYQGGSVSLEYGDGILSLALL
jgi:hypothetical protein